MIPAVPLRYQSYKEPPKPCCPNMQTRYEILDARNTVIADNIWYEDWAKALVESYNFAHKGCDGQKN